MIARLLLIVAASTSPTLFSASEPVRFQLTAPFNELFAHGRTDDTYTVMGTLTVAGGDHPTNVDGVTIGLRGNTSRRESECSFPKLKITLPTGAATALPLFVGMKSIKVGTHCGEAANDQLTARFGRLSNQQSPRREAFVYALLAAVGVPALKARPALITYRFSDATGTQRRSIERHALLLEDADDAIKRMGGSREITEQEFTTAQALFTPADTLAVAFGEALIGNFDWCLKMTVADRYRCDRRHPVWNIAVADVGGGKARPLLHDFDVSGMVTGGHPWFATVFTASFVPSHSQVETEVIAQVQRARTLFPRAELDRARAAFVARKSEAARVVEAAALDPDGRRIAREYVDAFFKAIESDLAFYRPVVASPGANVYASSARQSLCSAAGTAPPGTPVSDPIQTEGPLVQVILLDALWHWAPPIRCKGIDGPVWIEAETISRKFPPQ